MSALLQPVYVKVALTACDLIFGDHPAHTARPMNACSAASTVLPVRAASSVKFRVIRGPSTRPGESEFTTTPASPLVRQGGG